MNRIAVILIVVIISLVGSSSAWADVIPQWEVTVGGAESDTAYDVQPTADGGAIAAGFTSQGYMPAILVVKTDALGQVAWQRTLSLTNYGEQAHSVQQTNDGGFIVFGSAYQPALFDYRPWLIKLDAAGNTLWSTENGLTQQVTVDSAIIRGFERADGSFVLAGGSNTFTNVQQPWVATASVTGTLQSFVVYPSLATGYAEGTYVEDIASTPDGGFVLVGVSSPPLPGNAFLWKFGADAQPEWVQIYGGTLFRAAFGVEATRDGGYVLAGCEVPNCSDSVVVKTDSWGLVQWTQALPLSLYNQGRDIVEKPDGGYLLAQTSVDAAGSTTSTADLIELSGTGEIEQVTPLFGGSASTSLVRVRAVNDGFLVAGNASDGDAAGNQLYLFKGQFDSAYGTACPDFDGNQIVDAGDVAMVAAHWRSHSGAPGWNAIYDRNGDGAVDMADIMRVAASWGRSCSE